MTGSELIEALEVGLVRFGQKLHDGARTLAKMPSASQLKISEHVFQDRMARFGQPSRTRAELETLIRKSFAETHAAFRHDNTAFVLFARVIGDPADGFCVHPQFAFRVAGTSAWAVFLADPDEVRIRTVLTSNQLRIDCATTVEAFGLLAKRLTDPATLEFRISHGFLDLARASSERI